MTKRPPSTFWSKVSYQQTNAVRLLQAWIMSLMLMCAEANPNRMCENRADGSFDFFYFVLQWPGTFCSRGCCFDRNLPLPAAQFNIHGLWPAHIGGKSPCFCKSLNLGPKKITWELQQEMVTNWASMACPKPKPEGLWRHQWKKHGSCSGMDRHTYFQTAMNLHSFYDLRQVFEIEGIYPDGRMYDLRYLHEVLDMYIGEDPIITCSFNQMHQVYQIYEVYICLDPVSLLPFACPDAATFKTKCKAQHALFPEFNPLQPPSEFNPPVSYCTDPSSLALDELNPSDEENVESYLDTVDSELDLDDDEFQNFLGNRTAELEPDYF